MTGWLTNVASARQLGLPLTGHASRGGGGAPGISVANVDLANGTVSREALIGDIREGVLVTELIGHGVNPVTGDYSRGAAGFRIVDGDSCRRGGGESGGSGDADVRAGPGSGG